MVAARSIIRVLTIEKDIYHNFCLLFLSLCTKSIFYYSKRILYQLSSGFKTLATARSLLHAPVTKMKITIPLSLRGANLHNQ